MVGLVGLTRLLCRLLMRGWSFVRLVDLFVDRLVRFRLAVLVLILILGLVYECFLHLEKML